jgi:hypothetical protein
MLYLWKPWQWADISASASKLGVHCKENEQQRKGADGGGLGGHSLPEMIFEYNLTQEGSLDRLLSRCWMEFCQRELRGWSFGSWSVSGWSLKQEAILPKFEPPHFMLGVLDWGVWFKEAEIENCLATSWDQVVRSCCWQEVGPLNVTLRGAQEMPLWGAVCRTKPKGATWGIDSLSCGTISLHRGPLF